MQKWKTRTLGVLGLVGGTTWVTSKIYSTKRAINSAIDPSITDLYEPFKLNTAENTETITKQYYDKYITPGVDFLHRVTNFFKFMFARRLLNIAQGDNRALRLRAIEHLSQLKLDDWQYSLLAHMCDAKTAVGLARTEGTPHRFFLPPPRKYGTYSNNMLMVSLKDYLKVLYSMHPTGHSCVKKLISNLKLESQDSDRIIDHHQEEEHLQSNTTEDLILSCLDTIRHHSFINKYVLDIPNQNSLYLFMEVYLRFNSDQSVCILLSNILSNLSIHGKIVLEELYKSGWVNILAKWINHPDVRISGPAVQALANLDRDDLNDRFSSNLYLLYPKYRTMDKIAVDVVFIHGLLGNVFYTWRNNEDMEETLDFIGKMARAQDSIGLSSDIDMIVRHSSDPATEDYLEVLGEQLKSEWDSIGQDFEFVYYDIPEKSNNKDEGPYTFTQNDQLSFCSKHPTQCWPSDWLPNDCKHLRVLGINYTSNLSVWTEGCAELPSDKSIDERTCELLENLVQAGIGTRPTVWITHSMGGIIAKNVVANAAKSSDPRVRSLAEQCKAIFFYSTPHSGSNSATFNPTTAYVIWPSMEVTEMRKNSPILKRIHEDFLKTLKQFPMRIYSFIETKPTLVSALKLTFLLVDSDSGNPGIGEVYEIPQSHLGICKPPNRESFLYQKVLQVIRELVQEETKPNAQSCNVKI